jgi:twitching motility two-component system response regulator PilG
MFCFGGKRTTSLVLHVDDDADIRVIIRAVLEELGLDVIGAPNGPEGLALARKKLPDLIILDVRMPGMDGFELCAAIRADAELHATPVVLLTSLNDETSRKKGKLVGASAFITKPVSVDELRQIVGTLLGLPPRS